MAIIFFDNDGVVTLSDEMFSEKLIREKKLNREEVNVFFKEIFVPKCMIGEADLRKVLAPKLKEWDINESIDEILKWWFDSENNVDEQMIQLIGQLTNNDHSCYMLTNQEKYRTEYMISQMGFGILFKGIFSSAYLGYKKPSTKFYEKVLSEVSCSNPNEIFYIDDEISNIEEGEKQGFNCFHYSNNFKELVNWLKSNNLV